MLKLSPETVAWMMLRWEEREPKIPSLSNAELQELRSQVKLLEARAGAFRAEVENEYERRVYAALTRNNCEECEDAGPHSAL